MPPQVAGTPVPGGALTVVPGLPAYDQAAGPVTFSRQWMRGDVPIDGVDGNTRNVAAEDFVEGLRLVRSATNGAGTRSVEVVAIAAGTGPPAVTVVIPPPPQSPPLSRTRGALRPQRTADPQRRPVSRGQPQPALLRVVRADRGGPRGDPASDPTHNGIETFDGYAQFAVSVASANQFLRSDRCPRGRACKILAGRHADRHGRDRAPPLHPVRRRGGLDARGGGD